MSSRLALAADMFFEMKRPERKYDIMNNAVTQPLARVKKKKASAKRDKIKREQRSNQSAEERG